MIATVVTEPSIQRFGYILSPDERQIREAFQVSLTCIHRSYAGYIVLAGPSRQQSRYPLSPDDRQMPSSPGSREPASEPRLPAERRGSTMSRTMDLRSGEGRRPSFGQLSYAEMGERRETMSREAAAELRGYSDRCASVILIG